MEPVARGRNKLGGFEGRFLTYLGFDCVSGVFDGHVYRIVFNKSTTTKA